MESTWIEQRCTDPYRTPGKTPSTWTCPPHLEVLGERRCKKCRALLYDRDGKRL